MGINGEEIAVTTQDVKNATEKIELAAYYKSRIRFPPKKDASAAVMAGEIIECLESNGERFFVNQDIEPLKRLHAKLSGKSRPSRFTDRGNLVRALRKLKEYSYTNYQPTQQEVSIVVSF